MGSDDRVFRFDIDPTRKRSLVEGLDEIGLTLAHRGAIEAFELGHRQRMPWLFSSSK